MEFINSIVLYSAKCSVHMIWLQENVTKKGLQALNLTLDFDEKQILDENLTYIGQTLEVRILLHRLGFVCEQMNLLKRTI